MRKITATLNGDGPILREVLNYLVTNAGMEVVGESSDSLDLLCSIDRLRPEVVFLDGLDSRFGCGESGSITLR